MKNSVWLIEDWSEPFCDSPEYYGVCRTKADAEKELTRLNGLAYRKQLNKWREDQDRISEGGTPFVTAVHPELSFWQPYHAVEVPIIIVG